MKAKIALFVLGSVAICFCFALPCSAQDDVPGGDILLSVLDGDDWQPAVAYNSHAGQFLVVWANHGDLYGQRYDVQGVPVKGPFVVSDAPGFKEVPAVDYSLDTDSYLVVWEDTRNGPGDIYGQMIDANGDLLDNPSTPGSDESQRDVNFAVFADNGEQRLPDLAYDGSRYLVVWQSDETGSLDIYGRFVQGGGTVDATVHAIGDAGAAPREYPAVAYNAQADEYLVVFQYDEGSQAQILGRRVDPTGFLPGVEYTIASRTEATRPDVAAASWEAFVVVWSDRYLESGKDIFGRVVLPGADLSFDGDVFAICTAYASQYGPAIARSPSTGQFLVVWDDARSGSSTAYDIYGQRLLADANLAGTNFAINTGQGDQYQVAIAASQAPDLYLVAWQDCRSGGCDVYGQRVAWTGSLLWYEFGISAQRQDQTLLDVAFNPETEEYMVVWDDDDTGNIYGQRLSAQGWLLEEPQIIDADGLNVGPTVATDGSFWVVSYRDITLNTIECSALYSFGGVVTRWTIPDTAGTGEFKLVYGDPTGTYLLLWSHSDIYGVTQGMWSVNAGPFAISSGGAAKYSPDAAWDAEHQQFLAVWDEFLDSDFGVLGRLITPDGEFAGDKFVISGDPGFDQHAHADAVYNPDADEYLVVYGCKASVDFAICGRQIAWDGNLLASGDQFVIWQAPSGVSVRDPQVVYVASVQRYYVLWMDGRNPEDNSDLYGRWLAADGSPASPSLPFFRYPTPQEYPAMAYDPGRERVLVAWADRRRYTQDVYARMGALDTEPPDARFFHLPLIGHPGTTFLFSAGPSSDDFTPSGALMVRWDWTSDGVWNTEWSFDKVITQTAWLPGIYDVSLQVRDLVSNTATISHPVLVLPASGNKAPTARMSADANSTTVGSQLEFDTSASSDDETPDDLAIRWDWESDGQWDTDFSPAPTATHTFTMANEYTVRAEVRDAEGLTDSAFFNVSALPGVPLGLLVYPGAAILGPGMELGFRAMAWDAYGNRMYHPEVVWSVTEPLVGTIGADGVFTAGVHFGTYPDAILADSNGVTGTASVAIFGPFEVYLPLVMRGF